MTIERLPFSGANQSPWYGYRFVAGTALVLVTLATIIPLSLGGQPVSSDSVFATLLCAALIAVLAPPTIFLWLVWPLVVGARETARKLAATQVSLEICASDLAEARAEIANRERALDRHAIAFEIGHDGRMTYVNPELCRMSGHSLDELIGQTPDVLSAGQLTPDFWRDMQKTVASAGVWHAEICSKSKDGTLSWMKVTGVATKDASGEISGCLCIGTDVTRAVNRELSLKRTLAQLFEKATKSRAASVAKSNLISAMSQEIRAPLNGIIGALEFLRRTKLSKEQRDFVGVAVQSGEALLCSVDAIPDFATEAGAIEADWQPVDCTEITKASSESPATHLETPAILREPLATPEMTGSDGVVENATPAALPAIVDAHFDEMKGRLEEALTAMWTKSLSDFRKVAQALTGAGALSGAHRLRELASQVERDQAAADEVKALEFHDELTRIAAVAEAQFGRSLEFTRVEREPLTDVAAA